MPGSSDKSAQKAPAPPPASLEGLRERLAALGTSGREPRLGKRAVAVFGGMVAAPRQAAVYSITELAAAFDVHPSTLTRLAKALGYRGFADFQAVFRRHVAKTGHFYSEQASELTAISGGGQRGLLDPVARIARDERANITGMLNNLDAATVTAAAVLLAGAPRMRAFGLRQSGAIAGYLAYGLGMLRGDVGTLNAEHGPAHGLGQLHSGDVLVVVGFAPYTRVTVAAARAAHERGIVVIAITDSDASPLAAGATHTFVVPAGGHFFSNSMAAALVLVEGLLAVVATRLGTAAAEILKARESLIAAMDVEF